VETSHVGRTCRRSEVASIIGVLLLSQATTLGYSPKEVDPQQLSREARVAAERGEFDRAEDLYKQILRLNPNLAETHSNLGMVYFTQNKFAEAKVAFQSALRLNPQLARARHFLGITNAELGQFAEALPLLSEAFEIRGDPEMRRVAGLHLAQCYQAQGKGLKSAEVFERLRQAFPRDPDVLYAAAKFYSDRSTDALLTLRREAPESYQYHQIAAEIFQLRGEYGRAEDQYRQVLKLNPQLRGVHYSLGLLSLHASRDAEARQRARDQFLQELALDPSSAAAEYQLGLLARRSNHLEEAQQRFHRAIRLSPGFADAYVALGKILFSSGNAEESIGLLQKATELDAGNESAHYWLAAAFRHAGRKQEADREAAIFQSLHTRRSLDRDTAMRELSGEPPADTEEDEARPPGT